MELQSFSYQSEIGWSVQSFPELDSENTLVMLFCSPEILNHPEPIYEIAKHYPNSKIIGCSSAGEIYGANILDNSISVAVVKFQKTKIRTTIADILNANESYDAGKTISQSLLEKDLRGIFVLSDGLNINGSELVNGLNAIVEKREIIITGGLAADGSHFKKTWAIYNGEIVFNKVIGVGFYGAAIHIGFGSRGGWSIFGPERIITRSKDNILYELDGKPALSLYKQYLGEKASGLPATGLLYPLSIRKNVNDKNSLVRTILAIDEKQQSLTFAGDVPQGCLAQLMRANFENIISAADEASTIATERMANQTESKPILAIAISCVGRRLLLGERTEEETESTLAALPTGAMQVGFYSYGELSPYEFGNCDLHNQTMTLTTLSED